MVQVMVMVVVVVVAVVVGDAAGVGVGVVIVAFLTEIGFSFSVLVPGGLEGGREGGYSCKRGKYSQMCWCIG